MNLSILLLFLAVVNIFTFSIYYHGSLKMNMSSLLPSATPYDNIEFNIYELILSYQLLG